MIARARVNLQIFHTRAVEDPIAAAEQALVLDEALAEAHADKAEILMANARQDDAGSSVEIWIR